VFIVAELKLASKTLIALSLDASQQREVESDQAALGIRFAITGSLSFDLSLPGTDLSLANLTTITDKDGKPIVFAAEIRPVTPASWEPRPSPYQGLSRAPDCRASSRLPAACSHWHGVGDKPSEIHSCEVSPGCRSRGFRFWRGLRVRASEFDGDSIFGAPALGKGSIFAFGRFARVLQAFLKQLRTDAA
jgi:hypothetical protein